MGLTRPRAQQIYDIDYKQATRAVTTTNITLSGGAPSLVDGVTLSHNDRVLVTGQTTASQNGIYYVTTLGSGSNGTWSRSTDSNQTGELLAGTIIMVTEGQIYADTQWKLITDNPIVIGTTALTFTQNYMANSISGGTSNVVVNSNANVTISSAGTANVLTISNTGAYVSGVVSATGNITGSYILGNGAFLSGLPATYSNANVANYLPIFSGNITAGNISATGNITGSYILGNGSQLSGLPATYSNANVANYLPTFSGNLTAGNVSVSGNITSGNISAGSYSATGTITGGNILTVGNVSATGNVTGGNINGNYLYGNGIYITGLNAGSASQIANGATDISIPVASGNIAMSVQAQSNTVVISTGALSMYGTFATPKTLSSNVVTADNTNAVLFGPVSIAPGYNISIPNNSTLYIVGSF